MLETKSIAALAFSETPRKRKRVAASGNHQRGFPSPPTQQQQQQQQPLTAGKRDGQVRPEAAAAESCFTNAAFSSTPKKLTGRRRLAKENAPHPQAEPLAHPFPGLEVKSIAALNRPQQSREQQEQEEEQEQQLPINPFEVLRQPPKRKKREHACFENPGLNLELPEKQFNPYEVRPQNRGPPPAARGSLKATQNSTLLQVIRSTATPAKGFVNPGLNLRGSDAPASLNPFEIHRPSDVSTAACNLAGVANPALAEAEEAGEALPTSLKIGLPFTPTLGCRIDFHGLSLAQLTPSKLLAEKLVFSPVPAPKRSLGAISEESTMDIGKELDRYQLELENSINEAKLRKTGVLSEGQDRPRTSLEVELPKSTQPESLASPKVSLVVQTSSQEVVVQEIQRGKAEVERRLVCTRRRMLTEISEDVVQEEGIAEESDGEAQQESQSLTEEVAAKEGQGEPELAMEQQQMAKARLQDQLKQKLKERERERERERAAEREEDTELKEDVAYASDESDAEDLDELDFKAPTRFVRAYRPAAQPTKAPSKESLHSIGSSKSAKSGEGKAHGGGGMKNMIRKSIRRLMHPAHSNTSPEKPLKAGEQGHGHHNIINSIRHSLRRRPQKLKEDDVAAEEQGAESALPDISIIDTSERTMKLRSSVLQTEYMSIEQLTNEKKHTLRNSIRRSTRDVLRHVLFHKSQDAYATTK
ncbi:hypothetical protein KR018_009931 [Drosophila ironensis]|nr:hypothetical protein KR018_009931 [Drosophila ironensis]